MTIRDKMGEILDEVAQQAIEINGEAPNSAVYQHEIDEIYKEAIKSILQLIKDEVIGQDDICYESCKICGKWGFYRNELRAEQRKKLEEQ